MAEPGRHAVLTVLGSGTSVGVPTIACGCEVCRSSDPRDNRLRPSAVIRWNDSGLTRAVVFDTGPDFRQQALRAGIERVDAVLYTHAHADHILGLDDLRPFNYQQHEEIPVYAAESALKIIRHMFGYVFHDGPSESSRPRIRTQAFGSGPIEVAGVSFIPLALEHGGGVSHGFRFGNSAYLTDHSSVPEATLAELSGLDVLFLEGLRRRPHPTHSTIEESLRLVERLRPRETWLTHISHELGHARDDATLPTGVHLAYDGLEVPIEL